MDAVIGRNADRAVELMTKHLQLTTQILLDALAVPANSRPRSGAMASPFGFAGSGIVSTYCACAVETSNTSIPWSVRSATKRRPAESRPMACGTLNCPGAVPLVPKDLMKVPFAV